MKIFGLPLPTTEVALIAFIVAVLAGTFGEKILTPRTKESGSTIIYGPSLPAPMRFALAVLVILSLEILAYGLYALFIDSKKNSPKHNELTQEMILTFIKRKTCLENSVEQYSSAQYKIKAVDNLSDIQKMNDGEAQIRVAKAQEDLNTVTQQYHLPNCK